MKSAEHIKRSIQRLQVEADAETRERTLHDLVKAHAQLKDKTQAFRLLQHGRILMKQQRKRVAAMVVLAVVLIGVFTLGTGSVAFSQARHAVGSTLSWLKAMITGDTTAVPPEPIEAGGGPSDSNRKAIVCAARCFVPETEGRIWQSLRDRGIEFIQASADPEVYYAVLSREQAESFDAAVTLRTMASPRVMVLEGETAAIAMRNDQRSGGLALGWVPTISSDGMEIRSTISFHDGRNGFEIPNVATESGGVVLIYAKGMFPDEDGGNEPNDGLKEVLIRVQLDIQ